MRRWNQINKELSISSIKPQISYSQLHHNFYQYKAWKEESLRDSYNTKHNLQFQWWNCEKLAIQSLKPKSKIKLSYEVLQWNSV